MTIENDSEVEALKVIGRIVRDVLRAMMAAAEPGMTTAELDDIGRALLDQEGARSAPILAYNFPGATCISVNEIIAHGVPGERILALGDLINIDVSAEKDGFWADTGATFALGTVSRPVEKLLSATKDAQRQAMYQARAGRYVNDISKRIEKLAQKGGYSQVDGLNGHGVGRSIHEEPTVWNIPQPNDRTRLKKGQVIAIEPFFTLGDGDFYQQDDGWSLATYDGLPTAQFEHSIIVTDGAPIILTA